jgi:hypothetical protein
MIELQPSPDEYCRSYVGRMTHINGQKNKAEMLKLIRSHMEIPEPAGERISEIELIAKVSGLPFVEFLVEHTTYTFRRGVDLCNRSSFDNGSEFLRITGMRSAREGAYYCIECALNDIKKYGWSYWRKSHQLPGTTICAEHKKKLLHIPDLQAFMRQPHSFVNMLPMSHVHTPPIESEHKIIQQYLNITNALAKRKRPLIGNVVLHVLRYRAAELGLRVHSIRPEKLLSDRIKELFPHDWLMTVCPGVAKKKYGTEHLAVDGLVYSLYKSEDLTRYVLSCCALYSTAQEAIEAISAEDFEIPKSIGGAMWWEYVALRAMYIKVAGRYSLLKTETQTFNKFQPIDEKFGFVNLDESNGSSPTNALIAFYFDKKTSTESASIGNISVKKLNDLISKTVNADYLSVLSEIAKQIPRRPKDVLS